MVQFTNYETGRGVWITPEYVESVEEVIVRDQGGEFIAICVVRMQSGVEHTLIDEGRTVGKALHAGQGRG